jgi:hypothetical protein
MVTGKNTSNPQVDLLEIGELSRIFLPVLINAFTGYLFARVLSARG